MTECYLTKASRKGQQVWETDIVLVTAACQFIAMIERGDELREYALHLAKESLTHHDRQLIGAIYLAKKRILVESGGWNSTDVTLDGPPTHGLVT